LNATTAAGGQQVADGVGGGVAVVGAGAAPARSSALGDGGAGETADDARAEAAVARAAGLAAADAGAAAGAAGSLAAPDM
jgi:hypothetical protein